MNTQDSINIITVSITTYSERFYFWCLPNIGFEWIFLLHTVSRGFWNDHVLDWWKHKDEPNVLFLKYENLQKVCWSEVCILSCWGLLGYSGNAFARGELPQKWMGCSSYFSGVNVVLLPLRIVSLKSPIGGALGIPFRVLRRYKTGDNVLFPDWYLQGVKNLKNVSNRSIEISSTFWGSPKASLSVGLLLLFS